MIRTVSGVAIRGITACVPRNKISNETDLAIDDAERSLLIKTTGVRERRQAPPGLTAADMCENAAKLLMRDAGVSPDSIELLVLVTQTADYPLPASAIILQDRLGLPKTCIAFDVTLGCSGYIYGLSIVAGMIQGLGLKRALLLAGDVSLTHCNPKDKSAWPIFGDAGSATLLEASSCAEPLKFSLFSDGSRWQAIHVPGGGGREGVSSSSLEIETVSPGISRNRLQLSLDGAGVFSFASTDVVESLRTFLKMCERDGRDIDHLVLHQANLLINRTILRKLDLADVSMPTTLDRFGNTSSASIPLTLVSELSEQLLTRRCALLLCGYGVGLSWGNLLWVSEPLKVASLVEV